MTDLQNILSCIHRDLTLNLPRDSKTAYRIHSTNSILRHKERIADSIEIFIPALEQENKEFQQVYEDMRKASMEMISAVRQARKGGRDPGDDTKVKEAMEICHNLEVSANRKFNRQKIVDNATDEE